MDNEYKFSDELIFKYSKNDFKILQGILKKDDPKAGRSVSLGSTVDVISERVNLSKVKTRNTLNAFIKDGCVAEGVRQYRNKTYIVTDKGLALLKHVRTIK